jgi:hypothetical protein
MSKIDPRTAYSPASTTVSVRNTLPLEQRDQAFAADLHARLEQAHRFANAERGGTRCSHGVDRGDEQLRATGERLQRCSADKRRALTESAGLDRS